MLEDDKSRRLSLKTPTEEFGVHYIGTDSSDSDDHFSDAQSGLEPSFSDAPSSMDLDKTENVDKSGPEPEIEGKTYELPFRIHVPEKLNIIPRHKILTPLNCNSPLHQSIPTTMVEKIDPSTPSHGEVPGTLAHSKRAADAVPDIIIKAGHELKHSLTAKPDIKTTPGDLPIPITKVERADADRRYGEIPGTQAHEMRKKDAVPDIVELIQESPVLPTNPRSQCIGLAEHKSPKINENEMTIGTNDPSEIKDRSDGESGDDFDDFEEGEDAEFGDFDDTFLEPAALQPTQVKELFPVLDFTQVHSLGEIQNALEPHLNALFPRDTIDSSILPPVSTETSVFLTSRSASLWSQLVASPALHPPNWIQSRIRRLFLVSLGVPVDLDEILPASKQKKLILPSISLHPTPTSPTHQSDSRSISRLRQGDGNESPTSLDSSGKPSRFDSRRSAPLRLAPVLDLVSARQLCMKTDEALHGLTNTEITEHISKLKKMQLRAQVVLEYWTLKTDEQLGDREAFEGVIENLVKHARNIRK
ncbi:hypothetical protein K3495_g9549 [Podosphaera aphanis]|nr:hypothetical protein K3495_g9549 [Podosphaera aphanis]